MLKKNKKKKKLEPKTDCLFFIKGSKSRKEQCDCLKKLYCSFENECRFYKCNRQYTFDSSTGKVFKYIR